MIILFTGVPGFFCSYADGVIKMNGVSGNDHEPECAHALPSFPSGGSG